MNSIEKFMQTVQPSKKNTTKDQRTFFENEEMDKLALLFVGNFKDRSDL